MPKLPKLITLFVAVLLLVQGVLAPAVQAAESMDASFKCHQELSLEAKHVEHDGASQKCPETDQHCQQCHVHIMMNIRPVQVSTQGAPERASSALSTSTSIIHPFDIPPPKFI